MERTVGRNVVGGKGGRMDDRFPLAFIIPRGLKDNGGICKEMNGTVNSQENTDDQQKRFQSFHSAAPFLIGDA